VRLTMAGPHDSIAGYLATRLSIQGKPAGDRDYLDLISILRPVEVPQLMRQGVRREEDRTVIFHTECRVKREPPAADDEEERAA